MSLLGAVLRPTRLAQLALTPWLSLWVSVCSIQATPHQSAGGVHRECVLCSELSLGWQRWQNLSPEPQSLCHVLVMSSTTELPSDTALLSQPWEALRARLSERCR